ncbi:hypothetical protein SG34_000395 [Thalassomonas viridans]|uniref:Uncharacterized protein n=1 Tax=Thalassomonas viridans TaxID=137584 RepID=A0AAF0C9N7_9GAMM|nr:hypothetical protein [Thalassomonas viridans]WDE05445.1 hypothetical protein SG34_000395 [Thalassomonas viridans]
MTDDITPPEEQKPVASELLTLTDDFAGFSADCAFYCDALAAIAEDLEDVDDYTGYGIRRYSDTLKEQVILMDRRIHELQRRIAAQTDA